MKKTLLTLSVITSCLYAQITTAMYSLPTPSNTKTGSIEILSSKNAVIDGDLDLSSKELEKLKDITELTVKNANKLHFIQLFKATPKLQKLTVRDSNFSGAELIELKSKKLSKLNVDGCENFSIFSIPRSFKIDNLKAQKQIFGKQNESLISSEKSEIIKKIHEIASEIRSGDRSRWGEMKRLKKKLRGK